MKPNPQSIKMLRPDYIAKGALGFVNRIVPQVRKETPPGTIVHIGEKKAEKVTISVIDYDKENVNELFVDKAADCSQYVSSSSQTWINVVGLHETGIIKELGEVFSLHPLVMEDIANTTQRPKREDFGDYLYITMKMLDFREGIVSEQVSFVIGKNYLLTFQEKQGDVFDSVRERIRTDKGSLRKKGTDYLAYRLMDALVDNYFRILERIGDYIVELEEELLSEPSFQTLRRINSLKRELILLRKSVWPMREVVGGFEREESPLVKKSTMVYFRDVYDHTIQIIDSVETFRDMLSGMADLYLSSVSNRMNEIMKVLTIIATIFIPLTFVAGVYGMNFRYMPELEWKYGYFGIWAAMITMAAGMLLYFRRKQWL